MKKLFLQITYIVALLLIVNACSKVENKETEITNVRDLYLTPNGAATTALYFSLKTNKIVSSNAIWDLKFSGENGIQINANNTDSLDGRLNFIDTPFDQITVRAIFNKFAGEHGTQQDFMNNFKNLSDFGLNETSRDGWLNYDATSSIYTPVKDRTLILISPTSKTNSTKKLYIIETISIYKGAPKNPTINDKLPYLNFRFKEIDTKGIINL